MLCHHITSLVIVTQVEKNLGTRTGIKHVPYLTSALTAPILSATACPIDKNRTGAHWCLPTPISIGSGKEPWIPSREWHQTTQSDMSVIQG